MLSTQGPFVTCCTIECSSVFLYDFSSTTVLVFIHIEYSSNLLQKEMLANISSLIYLWSGEKKTKKDHEHVLLKPSNDVSKTT